jgi:hypothetical protein
VSSKTGVQKIAAEAALRSETLMSIERLVIRDGVGRGPT